METRNSIRERRQERIRRIMQENAKQARLSEDGQRREDRQTREGRYSQHEERLQLPVPRDLSPRVPSSSPLQEESQMAAARGTKRLPVSENAQLRDNDPERLWKSNPNPWESAGWRIAPLPSKDVRASKQGGPPPDRPGNDYRFIARGLFVQTVIAAALFAIVFFLFKTDNPIAKRSQAFVTTALTEKMDFQGAEELYKKWFAGAPSFIPFFGRENDEDSRLTTGTVELPVVSPLTKGSVVRSFAQTLSGVEISGSPEQPVLAAETGRVTLVSQDGENGETVVVQHAGGRSTVYGHLGSAIVAVDDWVEVGKTIGKLPAASTADADRGQSLLYFAVKENGRYVDPADVVPLD